MIAHLILSWAPAALWASALYWLSSRPVLPGPSLPISDKVLHLAAYLVLGTTLAWAGRKLGGARVHSIFLLTGVLFALSDEWHQSFVPGRDPSAGDLVADGIGLVLGYALARWFLSKDQPPANA